MDFRAFEATPGISVIIHPDAPVYSLAAVSNDFIKESGLKREEVIGRGLFEVFPKNLNNINVTSDQDLQASFKFILQNKEPHQIPFQRYDVPDNDGSFRQKYWRISNAPILSDEGNVLYIVHSALDITGQVAAEQKVESSGGFEKAYNFFMSAPVIIGFVKGDDYIIELANEGLLEVWGRTADVIGKPLLEAIPELEEQGFKALLNNVCATGEPFHAYEYPIALMRQGQEETLYFDFVYKPFYQNESTNKATGVISVGLDVTERVIARKSIKESEEKYGALFNSLDEGFCVIEMMYDQDGKPIDYLFLEVNPMFEQQTGLKDAAGKTMRQLVPNHDEHWFQIYGEVIQTGEALRFQQSSSSLGRWFDLYAFKVGSEDSRKVAVLFTDISERKKAEEALTQSETNLRNIILQAPVAMGILTGPSFVVEIANDRMYELWGRGEDELLNKSIFDGLPEVKDQGYEELLMDVYTTGKRVSAYGSPVTLPRNGSIQKVFINFLYEAFRGPDGGISGIMVVATDVTDQVLAGMKVEESHKELRFAMDAMPQLVWITLPNGYHDFYNKQWYDYTGLTYDESKNVGWNTVLHPDDKERALKVWTHSLNTGDPYNIEYRFKRFDGTYRWFLGRALPLKDESGTILKWFGTCTDIDDQKKAAQLMEEMVQDRTQELNITIKELQQSNAHLEDFAYAASHDLKEPLRKIRTFSDRLKQGLKERLMDEDVRYFERMDKATERMQNLIDDLLSYSYIASDITPWEVMDLNKKVEMVLEDLELEVADKKASVVVGNLPVILGHKRQMQQLFQNLISNALKFSKPGVAPEINITSTIQQKEGSSLADNVKSKQYNLIEISDNGIGFEQRYADQIFKMFQRLHGKQEYDGTGIGLAIARKVVENHHGFIEAESVPGEGTTFKIYLPVTE